MSVLARGGERARAEGTGGADEGNGADPGTLATWTAVVVVMALATEDPVTRALLAAAAMVAVRRGARRGAGRARRRHPGLRLVAVAAVASVGLNTLLSHTGATPVAHLPGWLPGIGGPLTLEALVFGVDIALGLTACLLAAMALSVLVEPDQLAAALPGPLRRTGAALGAALNLVPRLGRSIVAIREAQQMRGWRPRGLRSWAAVIVPAVLTAVEGSLQLAEAMEARGFGPGRRTRYRVRARSPADRARLAAALGALALFVVGTATGGDPPWYPYPVPGVPALAPAVLAACALLLVGAWTT